MTNQYKVHDLGWDGRGVARDPSGRIVMIAGALPGDLVLATVINEAARGPYHARLEKILEPSPDRVTHPCCFHHTACFTTPLGTWRYDCSLDWKKRHLIQTLCRIGGLQNPEVADVIPSPQQWGYRDRLEFQLFSDRGKWTLGYCSPDGYTPTRDCLIGSKVLRAGLNSYVTVLDGLANAPKSLPTESDRCSGPNAIRVVVRDNGRNESVAVLFVPHPGKVDFFVLAQALIEAKLLHGWQIRHAPSARSRFFQSQIIEKRGEPQIYHRVNGDRELVADPTVFSQVNRPAAVLLVNRVMEETSSAKHLLDLYGGYGAFALAYAKRQGGRAAVVESSVLACKAGQDFALANGLPVEFINADLGDGRHPLNDLKSFDLAILDPPRGGASAQALEFLNAQGPSKVIYLSCHPAVLARDLKKLTAYTPGLFQPVDLFPQTPDLETIAILKRNS